MAGADRRPRSPASISASRSRAARSRSRPAIRPTPNSLEFDAVADAGRARADPARLDGGRSGNARSEQVAIVSIDAGAARPRRAGRASRIGIGGGTGSYGRHGGVGVGGGVDRSRSAAGPISSSRPSCRCASSAAPTPPSPGRAAPNSRRAPARPTPARAAAASRLAAALFRDFPGESGRTIRVR